MTRILCIRPGPLTILSLLARALRMASLTGTVQRLDSGVAPGFSDPFVYLNVNRDRPIDTSKYKYVTFRYKIDRTPWWSHSGDRLSWDSARGVYPAAWLARLIFFGTYSPSIKNSSDSTKPLIAFDDWNTYQIDLSKGVQRGYWDPTVAHTGGTWTGLKYWIRFDFLEGTDPWVVHLDYVKLTGDDTANGSFTVKWSYPEAGRPNSLDFYASQNRNTCLANGQLISHWQAGKLRGTAASGWPILRLFTDGHYVQPHFLQPGQFCVEYGCRFLRQILHLRARE